MLRNHVFDRHIAVRRSGSKHKRAGFDLIRDDRIFRLMQSLYTTDPDHIRTCALDVRSHAVEEIRHVYDVRLTRTVLDNCIALCH